jgi:hypothetical protein
VWLTLVSRPLSSTLSPGAEYENAPELTSSTRRWILKSSSAEIRIDRAIVVEWQCGGDFRNCPIDVSMKLSDRT